MADSYSNILQLRLQETGGNAGTWGQLANDAVFELLEDAVAGIVSVSSNDGTITLTRNQGAADESRMAQIVVAGALTSSVMVVAPSISKWWFVRNNTVQATATTNYPVSVRLAGGVGVNIPADSNIYLVVSDGTQMRALSTSIGSGFVATTVFTSASAQFVPPSTVRRLYFRAVGGGAAGGGTGATGANDVAAGGGGGGGGYVEKTLTSIAAFVTIALSVGSGGSGVVGAQGGAGGVTIFDTVSAHGGTGGAAGTAGTVSGGAPGSGGSGVGGNLNVRGTAGQPGIAVNVTGSVYALGGSGGGTPLGGGGVGTSVGSSYGGGGGGNSQSVNTGAQAGFAGASGVVVVDMYT